MGREIRLVAGLDAAFSADESQCLAGAVLWDVCSRSLVEEQTASLEVSFPYRPGLLAFREIPGLLEAFKKLKREPDALICDGQGYAHPRRFGLACGEGYRLPEPVRRAHYLVSIFRCELEKKLSPRK